MTDKPWAPLSDIDAAWLAGTLDGEGSIGLSAGPKKRWGHPRGSLRAAMQMGTTCERTALRVVEIIDSLGVTARHYGYQRKNSDRWKDCWNIRVVRLADLHRLSVAMAPLSTTKRDQWELMREFTARRLAGVQLDELGRIMRGGDASHRHKPQPYTDEDFAIYERFRELNRKGPSA